MLIEKIRQISEASKDTEGLPIRLVESLGMNFDSIAPANQDSLTTRDQIKRLEDAARRDLKSLFANPTIPDAVRNFYPLEDNRENSNFGPITIKRYDPSRTRIVPALKKIFAFAASPDFSGLKPSVSLNTFGRIMGLTAMVAGTGMTAWEKLPSVEILSHISDTSKKTTAAPAPVSCSPNQPMLVDTPLGTFFETDNNICKRILQAVSAPSERFTQYNENVGIRAKADGTFEYRIVVFKAGSASFEDLSKEYKTKSIFGSGKVRQAYLDTYMFKTSNNLKDASYIFDLADRYMKAESAKRGGKEFDEKNLALGNSENVQNAIKFRQSHQMESIGHKPISAQNFQAMVGSWLISPLPFSFYAVNLNYESGFKENAHNRAGTATGLSQFTSARFLTMVKLYGKPLGFNDLYDKVMAISKRHKHDDKVTIHDKDYLAIFNKESRNPYISAAFGVMNFAWEIAQTQTKVDAGEIILPEGRKKLNEIDARMLHFMSSNAEKFWRVLNNNPNTLMRDVFPDLNRQNKDAFKDKSAKKYYDDLVRTSGFGKREIDVSKWIKDNHGRPFATNINERELIKASDIGTKFKIVATPDAPDNVLAVQKRPNVDWIQVRYKGMGVEPLSPVAQNASLQRSPG